MGLRPVPSDSVTGGASGADTGDSRAARAVKSTGMHPCKRQTTAASSSSRDTLLQVSREILARSSRYGSLSEATSRELKRYERIRIMITEAATPEDPDRLVELES